MAPTAPRRVAACAYPAPSTGGAARAFGAVASALLVVLLIGVPGAAATTTSFDQYVSYPCYARVQVGGEWQQLACPGTYGDSLPLDLVAVTRVTMSFVPLDEPFQVAGIEPEGYGRERGVWWEIEVARATNTIVVGEVEEIPAGSVRIVTVTFGSPETGRFTFRFWPFEEAVADWNLLVRMTIETQG